MVKYWGFHNSSFTQIFHYAKIIIFKEHPLTKETKILQDKIRTLL
jgi:hypothetical protein